jgi:hypothetical protein
MTKPERLTTKSHYQRFARQLAMVVTVSLLSVSCRDNLEVFQIERLGTFSFSTDDIVTQYANDVKFYHGKQVLYYYDANTFELYSRNLIEAKGTNSTGGKVTVSFEVDFLSDQSFIGIYRPQYQQGIGGIHSFNVLNEVSNGVYESYNLDPDFLTDTYVRVERQNLDEKLLLGNFIAKLRNDKDPNDKLTLYQGQFKDISYAK